MKKIILFSFCSLLLCGCASFAEKRNAGRNPFTVAIKNGIPVLCKNGEPVPPVMFWQSPLAAADVAEFKKAGVEIFTTTRSYEYDSNFYWTGENQYDFSMYDKKIADFFRDNPDGYLIPRIFVYAPYWWLEKNPDQVVGFTSRSNRKTGPSGGTWFHESFASKKWLKEQGEAFSRLLKHINSSPYADRIIGIHVAGGSLGEWHYWSGGESPDTSKPMAERYGKPVPPEMERRGDYYEAYYTSTVDAIDHFCKLVKKERPDWLTVAFYGYFYGGYTNSGRHLGLQKFLTLDSVDIVAAPHVYSRRTGGEDAYFRALPATFAKNGKLFFDEADDRTILSKNKFYGIERIMANTHEESISMLRREFGYALTHCSGMWYMDIDTGNFRHPDYMREVARSMEFFKRGLALPWRRVSEIAVITDFAGRIYLPPARRLDMTDEFALRELQFSQICRIGAPFDLYAADDIDTETLKKYKMIIMLDGIALGEKPREVLKSLQKDGRSIVWFYGAGAFDRKTDKFTSANIKALTGLDVQILPQGPVPFFTNDLKWENRMVSPGFAPDETSADFGTWSSWYFNGPYVKADKMREIAQKCGVFIYNDSSDVISAAESSLMIHTATAGKKLIRLPKPKKVTDMVSGKLIGENISEFVVELPAGATGLYELK